MKYLLYDYLSPKQLAGFDKYKYKSVDTSPFARYVMHPFWDQFVKIYPLWLSPNLLTFAGWLLTLGNFLALASVDWDFNSANNSAEISNVSRWLWLGCSVSQILSHTLDGTDGKQARRTKSSSPLGEMFDHGLDSLAVFLMAISMYTLVGYGIKLDEFYLGMWSVLLGFYLAHWEKYNTSVMFLPWAYDFSQVALAAAYFVTFWYGTEVWQVPFFGTWKINNVFKFAVHFSFFGMGLPVSVWHIIKARLEHRESCPSIKEGLVPLFTMGAVFCTFSVWAWLSPSNILFNHPRILYVAIGIVFSNISCRLIVAQMSSTLCERYNRIFLVLIPTVVLALTGLTNEASLLYAYTVFAVLAHVHYGICVVNQLCNHLRIRCFLISSPKPVSNGR